MARGNIQESALYILVEYRNPAKGNSTHIIRSPTGAVLADGYDHYGMGKSGKRLRVRVEDANARPDLFIPYQTKSGVESLEGATSPKSGAKSRTAPDGSEKGGKTPETATTEGEEGTTEDTVRDDPTDDLPPAPPDDKGTSGTGKGSSGKAK